MASDGKYRLLRYAAFLTGAAIVVSTLIYAMARSVDTPFQHGTSPKQATVEFLIPDEYRTRSNRQIDECVKNREDRLPKIQATLRDMGFCVTDVDCAVVFPGCPLGCYAAVNNMQFDAAVRIVTMFHLRCPGRCMYRCPVAHPECHDGQCVMVRDG